MQTKIVTRNKCGDTFIVILFLFLFFIPTSSSAAILSRPPNNLALVGYWKFDEATSTRALDSSGNGNHGTLSGFALSGVTSNWVNGKHGKALDFDGSNDHITVTVPAGSVLDFTTASRPTIAFWLKVTSISSDVRLIEEVRDGGWGVEYTTGGLLRLITYGVNTVGWSGVVAADNTWHYYVVTYDGTNATLYKDGVIVSAQGYSPGWSSSASTLYLGGEGSFHLNGRMDDVRIYSRALSATEVKALYQSGQVTRKQVSNQGLVGYWAFNEGRGLIAGDSSGNGRNGTLINMDQSTDWVGGKRGKALDFDGVDDYVEVASNSIYDTPVGTVYFWFKTNGVWGTDGSDPDNAGLIFGRHNSSFSWSGITVIQANSTNGGGVTIQLKKAGASVVCQMSSSNNLADNRWHSFSLVFSQTNGQTGYLYIDGALVTTCVNNDNWTFNNQPIRLANSDDTFWEEWQGTLDDVRFYSRALSASEVATLYRQSEAKINSSQNDQLTNGLVGLWSFDGPDYDAASKTAYDRSGQGNNATNNGGAIPKAGKVGQAINFDGVNDYFSMDGTTDPTAYTISAWVKKNSTAGATIFLRTDAGGPSGSYSHMLYINNGKFASYVWDGGVKEVIGSTSFNTNEWYHVVGTVENNGFIRLYVNGVQEGTPVAIGTMWGDGDRYRVGQSAGCGSCGYFDGIIDEVRLYNRVLSATEVKQLYLLGK